MSDEVKEKPVTPEAKPVLQTGPKNIDWKAAFKFYCTNTEDGRKRTYKDVSAKFDVSETVVEAKGTKENWVKAKEDIGKRGMEEFKKQRVDDIAKSEDRHLKIWRGLQQTALELLKDLRKDIQAERASEVVKKYYGNSSATTELRNIVGTLETSIGGERLVLGLPSTVTKGEFTSKVTELTPEMTAEMDAMMKKDADPTDTKVS